MHVKLNLGLAYSTMDGICAKGMRRIAVFDEINQNIQEKEPGILSPFQVDIGIGIGIGNARRRG